MRILPAAMIALASATVVACDGSTPAQPTSQDAAGGITMSSAMAAANGKPELDPSYANGKTVYMIGPKLIVGARESMPNVYAKAEELYLVVYPQPGPLPVPGAGPVTLPSGYQPQCNPCFHPGLPPMFVYHDHVLTGAPGMGNNGTAGEFKAPWKIIILVYSPEYAASKDFKPVTSEAELDAAEEAGNVFMTINPDGANKYEVEPGNLLICPLVSSHA
jgi:hypothetical protein